MYLSLEASLLSLKTYQLALTFPKMLFSSLLLVSVYLCVCVLCPRVIILCIFEFSQWTNTGRTGGGVVKEKGEGRGGGGGGGGGRSLEK